MRHRRSRPVLVGDADDPHVDAVAARIRADGVDPVILDAQRLRTDGFHLDGSGLAIGNGMPGVLDDARRGWLRRLAPAEWAGGVAHDSHDGVIRSSWMSLLVGWLHTASLRWLTALPELLQAENKVVQSAAARELGIEVPRTIITSSLTAVRAAFQDRVLVKPLGRGHFVDAGGRGLMVPATAVAPSELGPEVAVCPFLFQEALPARRHLRVVTVCGQSWVAALDADGLPVDWRVDALAHNSFVPADGPTGIRVGMPATRLAARLDIGFSSQDWIDVGDRLVFLDLNPAGQWLFLPEAVAAQGCAKVAQRYDLLLFVVAL